MKYALRWRASGRWESQQAAEQKTSLILPELQVETEQRMTLPPTRMGLRHMEQRKAGSVLMGPLFTTDRAIPSQSVVGGNARAAD